MSLVEAGEIFAYWEHNPPPHLLLQAIARLLGWAPSARPADTAAIAAAPPPGLAIMTADGLGMPAPLFDVAAMRERNRERRNG
jgi:hypothetical protein